jgi:predicted RNase H-like nuclease
LRLAGIDGCREGWVVAETDDQIGSIGFRIVATDDVGSVLKTYAEFAGVVAIDIPIGLTEGEPRKCDQSARRLLQRPRASSVFPAPCRAALGAQSYPEALNQSRHASGRGMSIQAYGILHKIRLVDEVMTPALQCHVREVHPEVVFARLSGTSRGLHAGKKSPDGRRIRLSLLERRLGTTIDVDSIRIRLGRSRVAADDLLDALACFVAADNIAAGREIVLPQGQVPLDRRGLRMEIVA